MKIYVGNIAHSTSEDELRAAFTPHGCVDSCRLATDKMSGKSKGFGFIEMNNDNEAKAAITALDGTQLGGRTLKVNVSIPKTQ
jgi:RNA recognition motif-containing protein